MMAFSQAYPLTFQRITPLHRLLLVSSFYTKKNSMRQTGTLRLTMLVGAKC